MRILFLNICTRGSLLCYPQKSGVIKIQSTNAQAISDSFKFFKGYQSDARWDTTLLIGSDTKIVVQGRITKQACYILPKKYIFDSSMSKVVIYGTETKLYLKNKPG